MATISVPAWQPLVSRFYVTLAATFVWGFGATVAVHLSRPSLANTDAWYRAADFLAQFGG